MATRGEGAEEVPQAVILEAHGARRGGGRVGGLRQPRRGFGRQAHPPVRRPAPPVSAKHRRGEGAHVRGRQAAGDAEVLCQRRDRVGQQPEAPVHVGQQVGPQRRQRWPPPPPPARADAAAVCIWTPAMSAASARRTSADADAADDDAGSPWTAPPGGSGSSGGDNGGGGDGGGGGGGGTP